MKDETRLESQNTDGKIIGLLVAIFYGLLTLLPDSNTQFVTWSWVFLWQAGLMFPVLWLLWQLWQQKTIQLLGNKLDWVAGLLAIVLIISAAIADYPNQARWYSWAGLCLLAALYALNNWLGQSPARYEKLLIAQGYLNLAFISISLILWFSQIVIPELNRLSEIKQQYNISLPFDFSIIELRNGFPIGHQNYVAGYLVLAIPLLIALTIIQTGWRRWLWISAVILGLIDLYSTSSRGGWIGLVVVSIISFMALLIRSNLSRRWLTLGGVGVLAILLLLVLANTRLNTLITATFTGSSGGEFAYRLITTTTGWKIGIKHLFFGAAPGSVPLLYQQYRPTWAGREAELAYQLHSTPAHLWAELGLSGIAILISAIALLIYLGLKWLRTSHYQTNTEQIFVYSIYASLLGYGINSLTDYQLDNICISGTIIIYLAILATFFRSVAPQSNIQPKIAYGLTLGGLGIILAMVLWLFPIHSAWNSSSIGFLALSSQEDNQTPEQKAQLVTTFTQHLTQAHQLAPWEPYYPYQLGWNLGNMGLQTSNPQERQKLIETGINWFTKGIEVSPNQEFGHTNLAWLLMAKGDATTATKEFARSAQLMSAKRGVFYGLGLSLLAQRKTDLGIEAITLEALRDPINITSPIWNSPQLKPIYLQVINRLVARYTDLLQQQPSTLNNYLHYCLGGLHWWQGNYQASRTDWEAAKFTLGLQLLDLAESKPILPNQAANGAIAAWLNPARRQTLLQSALITASSTIPSPQLVQDLAASMDSSSTFEQWLKQKAPTQQYRRSRAGFGVLSRHNDGPAPVDFLPVVENAAMTNLFAGLFPSAIYMPQLDLVLQPVRDLLLKNISLAP